MQARPPSPGPRLEVSPPPGRRLGSVISAVFGVIYIEVNAGSLPGTMMLMLRVLGAAVFLLVLIRLWLDGPQRPPPLDGGGVGFGTRYWLIVALEAAGIVIGGAALRAVGLGSATVAWVSVVVGLHFLALAAVWGLSLFRRLGTAIALCGAVAIVGAAAGADTGWVAGIGGVLPGGLLLWAATRRATPSLAVSPNSVSSAAGCRE
jgi:hypothetical protein